MIPRRSGDSPHAAGNVSLVRRAAWITAGVLSLATSGCVAGRRFAASPEEYAVYRRALAAVALEDRLEASQRYLLAYPEGAWAPEVNTFFARAEPLYFTGAKRSIPGLEAYLRALPRGPSAKEATLRLRDLRAAEKADRTDLTGTAQSAEENVTREAERRAAVRERLGVWIGLFLDPVVFAHPMAEAKGPLIVPWSLGLPWPLCTRPPVPTSPQAAPNPGAPGAPPDGEATLKIPAGAVRRCTKLLQLDYRAVDGGEAQERQALLEIALWQDEDGRPVEVSIGGPDLFLRLQETLTARAASSTDPEAKLQGAERAVELANEIFGKTISTEKTCKKTADSDVARLSCRGVTLRVLAGALDGEDDRFVIRATP